MGKPWEKYYDKGVRAEIDMPKTTCQNLLKKASEEFTGCDALIYEDKTMNYGQLYKIVSNIGANLRVNGLDKGDKVCVFLPNIPETVLAFGGIQQAGLVGVMTNPLYSPEEILFQVNNSEAKALITSNALIPKVLQILGKSTLKNVYCVMQEPDKPVDFTQEGIRPWEELLTEQPGFKFEKTEPEDLALLQYTGGTTGISKGCMLSQWNLISNTLILQETFKGFLDGPKERFIAVLPYFHIYGLQLNILFPLLLGSATCPVPRFTPISLFEVIEKQKLTVLPSAPAIFSACISRPELKKYDLSSVKLVFSGSAPLVVSQKKIFEEVTGAKISEGYGLSEASPATHFSPIYGLDKPGSIGLPLPMTEAKIVDLDDRTKELPQGEEGELCVKGPQVMSGYYKNPKETADVLDKDGWLRTGDIAKIDRDGYYFITGRKKELIITGGFNVYPREIEEVLYKHEAIKEAAVKGIADGLRGEVVKAYVVLKEGFSLTKNDLIAYCRKHLANYKVPREVAFMEALPKSAVGKLLRRELN
ncbi:MAG: long-chain fatty acid--CoA ligase [Candidatus Riflebacteria bacterium]|nr:long-chain fatty acid--CoA ligase [Candidatus Riflebacteria bacterium]